MKLVSGIVPLDPFNADARLSQDSIFILSFFMENIPYAKQASDRFNPKPENESFSKEYKNVHLLEN